MLGREVVEELLQPAVLVLPKASVLLLCIEFLSRLAPDVAQGDLRLLGTLPHELHEFVPAFFGQARDLDPDHLAVILRVETEAGPEHGPLDRRDLRAVERANYDQVRIRRHDVRHVLQGRGGPVVLHGHRFHQRWTGSPGVNLGEPTLQHLQCLRHVLASILQ